MPDGAGYLVLDKFGGVNKFGERGGRACSAPRHALLGSRPRPLATSPSCPCSAKPSATTCFDAWATWSGTVRRGGREQRRVEARCTAYRWRGDRHLRREAAVAAQRRHDPAHELTPSLGLRSLRRASEHDDGAQHLAALHLVERVLDLVERDGLAHEAVEVEAALRGRGR